MYCCSVTFEKYDLCLMWSFHMTFKTFGWIGTLFYINSIRSPSSCCKTCCTATIRRLLKCSVKPPKHSFGHSYVYVFVVLQISLADVNGPDEGGQDDCRSQITKKKKKMPIQDPDLVWEIDSGHPYLRTYVRVIHVVNCRDMLCNRHWHTNKLTLARPVLKYSLCF